MGIDMSNYRMIYKEQVFNVVSIMPTIGPGDNSTRKIENIDAIILSDSGELVRINDEASMFKFLRR